MHTFKQNLRLYILGVLVLVTVFIWYGVARAHGGVLTIAFLDVGQGDSTFIESPSGIQVLIDGGPDRSVLRQLSGVMPFFDRSIDVVVATHPDTDHIGGLPDVLERFEVAMILEPGIVGETGAYTAFIDAVENEGATNILARRGHILDLGDGAYLRVLFPDRDVSGVEPNAGSVIAQLIYGETEILLTGDAPQAIEKYIAALDGETLHSDVLKVGHHGSDTSSAPAFVGLVSPQWAVISAGENNRFGHPHEEVLEVFEQFDVEVLTTFDEGAVVFESDGKRITKR